jgi:hypothetical protein
MWNVFVIDNGEGNRINSQPYDIEQIAELLNQLAELDEPIGGILIKPTTHSDLPEISTSSL